VLGVVLAGLVTPLGMDVGVLGIVLPVGALMVVLVLMLLGTASLGLPVEAGIASVAGVVVAAGVTVGFFLLLVTGFFLRPVVGALVVSLAPGVVVLGVVVLGVDFMSPPTGAVDEGVVVSVVLGFLSLVLLIGFFLLPAVLLGVFFLAV
jgi:hypothetical protein